MLDQKNDLQLLKMQTAKIRPKQYLRVNNFKSMLIEEIKSYKKNVLLIENQIVSMFIFEAFLNRCVGGFWVFCSQPLLDT